jgi:hypothetical protein
MRWMVASFGRRLEEETPMHRWSWERPAALGKKASPILAPFFVFEGHF